MRKFKLFFYPIYLITALVVVYFSFDILVNLDAYKEDITLEDFTFYTKKVPVYITSAFIFIGLLMLVEIVSENLQIMRLKSRLKKAEEETTKYKAKLFDQSETSQTPKAIEEEDLDDEDDSDE